MTRANPAPWRLLSWVRVGSRVSARWRRRRRAGLAAACRRSLALADEADQGHEGERGREQGEHRVVGQRRGEIGALVVGELAQRLADDVDHEGLVRSAGESGLSPPRVQRHRLGGGRRGRRPRRVSALSVCRTSAPPPAATARRVPPHQHQQHRRQPSDHAATDTHGDGGGFAVIIGGSVGGLLPQRLHLRNCTVLRLGRHGRGPGSSRPISR